MRQKHGDGGHRSPYLPHAKRALYHLSYIPVKDRSKRQFSQYIKEYCGLIQVFPHYPAGSVTIRALLQVKSQSRQEGYTSYDLLRKRKRTRH